MYDKRIPPGKMLSSIDEKDWLEVNQLKDQTTIYPRSINFMDIDKAVYDWFVGRDIIIRDEKVPVFFLSPEKWAEFKKQWEYMDSGRTVSFPYITIRRSNAPTLSQNPVKGRIPGKTFTTYRMPIYTPAGPTYRHYKVPQPIKVDMAFEIRVLTVHMSDINLINETLLRHFASLQAYLDIDKHYMPMTIESISDESDVDNAEDERVIHTLYSIQVQGYIIDENEFEVKDGISNVIVNIDEDEN